MRKAKHVKDVSGIIIHTSFDVLEDELLADELADRLVELDGVSSIEMQRYKLVCYVGFFFDSFNVEKEILKVFEKVTGVYAGDKLGLDDALSKGKKFHEKEELEEIDFNALLSFSDPEGIPEA